jgi:hypothetical protein
MFAEDGQPIEENIRIIEEAIAQRVQQRNNHQFLIHFGKRTELFSR